MDDVFKRNLTVMVKATIGAHEYSRSKLLTAVELNKSKDPSGLIASAGVQMAWELEKSLKDFDYYA